MKAIQVSESGGPKVLQYEDVPDPTPGDHQALIQLQAVGVNYIDVYTRSGLLKIPLPTIPGLEGAGTVVDVGKDVTEVVPGDLVAYAGVPRSYAEKVVASSKRLVRLPEGINAETGAAAMLQGMTAHYLCHSAYPLKPEDTMLVHAGAGGTGLLIIQIAKSLGARVITTVSTEAKASLAKEAGADHVILYTKEDFEQAVKEITSGLGVQVVYESVGEATFDKSLACLARRGYIIAFGNPSGSVPPVDTAILNRRGSVFLTRPSLNDYTATREEMLYRANDILGWIKTGKLKLRIHDRISLKDAAEAHTQLEGRHTTGKLLLIP
jgi:NADPH2:quinone reductase